MTRMRTGIRKHRDGSLEVRFIHNGERYMVRAGTHSELKSRERILRRKLEEEMYEMQTLDTYFKTWIERKKLTSKQATPYRYENWYWNHISPPLGHKRIGEITRSDVLRLQENMAAKYSPSSVNYTTRVLKIIFNSAIDDRLIDQNPAARAKDLKTTNKPATQTYHRALTEEEQLLFLQAAQNSYYYEFFALLLLTGLRHGEAAALTWGDIDWSANLIRVCRTLTYDLNGHTVTGPPKSASSRRDIPMNEQIRTILQRQAQKTVDLLEMDSGEHLKAAQRVFFHRLHPDGFLNNRTANIELRKVLQQLTDEGHSIPSFTLHALRDTFATRFIEQGGNPQTLKSLLGHSSLSMTMDLYSQVMESTRQKEMNQMEITI